MKKYILTIPIFILAGQLYWILVTGQQPDIQQEKLYPVPEFSLPSLYEPEIMLGRPDLLNGKIRVVNFFASWCGPCKVEHPLLMELGEKNIPVFGINFQDPAKMARMFLARMGNPYRLVAWDGTGSSGPDWNIESIPQTFVLDDQGHILYHHSGRLRKEDLENHILPLAEQILTP